MSRSEETTSAAQKIHTEDENEAGARVRYKQVKEEGEEEGGSSALLLLPSPSSVFSSGGVVGCCLALPCLCPGWVRLAASFSLAVPCYRAFDASGASSSHFPLPISDVYCFHT